LVEGWFVCPCGPVPGRRETTTNSVSIRILRCSTGGVNVLHSERNNRKAGWKQVLITHIWQQCFLCTFWLYLLGFDFLLRWCNCKQWMYISRDEITNVSKTKVYRIKTPFHRSMCTNTCYMPPFNTSSPLYICIIKHRFRDKHELQFTQSSEWK
jgi:hypothetical protein